MKFKVGDKVRALTNGYTGVSKGQTLFVTFTSGNYFSGGVTRGESRFGGLCMDDFEFVTEKDINDLSTLEVGDVVVDSDGDERTILAVCGRLVALSAIDNPDVINNWYTDKELVSYYKLKEEKTETIEIEGKKYTASEIKEALKKAGK